MGKNVGLTYVKDFSFPAEQGFSGSAGVHQVRGYQRGGRVKKDSMHGKLTREGEKMGYAYGGQVKGYGKSGNTSAEFKMKKGKQDTMDHGVQPAQKGANQAEIEAGGNKRLKAGYKHGGVIKGPKKGVHRVRALQSAMSKDVKKTLKGLKGVKSEYESAEMRRIASGSKMPKNVKAKGGLAKYAAGGPVKKAAAAQ